MLVRRPEYSVIERGVVVSVNPVPAATQSQRQFNGCRNSQKWKFASTSLVQNAREINEGGAGDEQGNVLLVASTEIDG